MRELVNRLKENWALIRRSDHANTKLAMFVHGFRGSYLQTWGKLPDLIRQHADYDEIFTEWDYLFIGYNTGDIETYLDIASLLCSQWKKAEMGDKPFNQPYDKLALLGHSLGTLGIRQSLCAWSVQSKGMMQAIHSVTLFGTPLNGSFLANFAIGYPIGSALKPRNPQLRMLRTWVETAYDRQPWPKARLVLGQGDKVVGHEFAELIEWPGDDVPDQTTLDHSDLVKPGSWDNSTVVDFIARALR